jgi:hypothetical protein
VEFNGQELVGYLASALVVTSLSMRSVVRLRLFSLAGSATFLTYGLLIGSVPIVATNIAILGLNVWFLSKEFGGGRDLNAVVVPPDSPFLADFLAHHASDIAHFQPEWMPAAEFDVAIVVNREGLPAGVLLGRRDGTHLDISLDYVLPAFRDSRIGRWLYGQGAAVFRSLEVTDVSTPGGNENHRGYLQRVGFVYDPMTARWTKPL